METPYVPINCSYYDRLEAWAVKSETLRIVYYNEQGKTESTEAKINDLKIKDGVEFALLSNGQSLRLDYLHSINGIELPSSC